MLICVIQNNPVLHFFVKMQSKIMLKCSGEFLYTFLEKGIYKNINQVYKITYRNTKIHFPSVFSIFHEPDFELRIRNTF